MKLTFTKKELEALVEAATREMYALYPPDHEKEWRPSFESAIHKLKKAQAKEDTHSV